MAGTQGNDAASSFLMALDRNAAQFCFQTFDDSKARRDRHLARTIHGPLARHRAQLERLNARGAGVFVAINAITPGQPRTIQNLARIRAVWQDDDHGWTGTFPIPPSLVVQTSVSAFPKFQRLWLGEDLTAPQHQAIMGRLIADYGSDPGARDLVRVLRLPGFYHRKDPDRPQLVELMETSGMIYGAAELTAAFPPLLPGQPKRSSEFTRGRFDGHAFGGLVSALAHIPADDRDVWFRVGAALKLEFGEAARPLWDGWSATSAKYDARSQEKLWRSLRRGDGVTLGTVYHIAREHGFDWRRP